MGGGEGSATIPGMTEEQRWFFDCFGYLHLPGALHGEHLAAVQEAAHRYVATEPDHHQPPFGENSRHRPGSMHVSGFRFAHAYDKSMEALMAHEAVWPTILEFTMGRPRFYSGILFHNRHGDAFHPVHACAKPDPYNDGRRYFTHEGRIRCTDFVIFWYLSDVSTPTRAISSREALAVAHLHIFADRSGAAGRCTRAMGG